MINLENKFKKGKKSIFKSYKSKAKPPKHSAQKIPKSKIKFSSLSSNSQKDIRSRNLVKWSEKSKRLFLTENQIPEQHKRPSKLKLKWPTYNTPVEWSKISRRNSISKKPKLNPMK